MIQDLNNILYEAANISIKKKIIKKVNGTAKVKKSQQSKWFDLPLINMKKQLCDKEKLFKKYNKDPYIRSSFFALLKKYRKARKTKYREFRADLIDQLDNLREENPKSYWTLLESLKNSDKKTEKSSNITSTEWAEYFKDLNKKPVTPSPNIIEFLRNLENAKVFTELDILITDKEISDAIHTLKNKKSCGPDSISNEMIKNSQSFLIKSLNHVFNKILSTGNYPQIWANGFITALFKNGSKDDPSNYRGLTVTSCLSKTRENLQCTTNSKQSDLEEGKGYKTLETILERCLLIERFPIPNRLENLTDENGDMISQEANLNFKCLTNLYNRARPLKVISDESFDNRIYGIVHVLAKLVVYLEESRIYSDAIPVFKLADLTRMYTSRIEQFGVDTSGRENLKPLPKNYTIVPPVVLPKEPAEIPTVHGPIISDVTEIPSALNVEYSLKASTECKKGKDVRRSVLPDSRVPGNWDTYMTYLAEQLIASASEFDEQKQVNDARKDLFTRKGKAIDNNSPSVSAILEHTNLWFGKCLES
ncbi:unnamed protein product [Mytilus edulis]|uniref:Uncharacterized protein n=1 Tax=Mytilus edulis TaxID=6550 RepID=A0A8S3S3P3_MYTED|nr:unnamed protein product [Mytilus edulis]